MPLILLGLIVVIGIVIYALIMYGNSDDEEIDTRPVRERYSHVFDKMDKVKDRVKGNASYTVVADDDGNSEAGSSDGMMHFPDDAEVEKRKRNINQDLH